MSSWTPTTYKTANWSDNNAALKQRVSSSIWFDAEMAWEAKPSAKYQLLGTRQRKDTLFRYLAVVWFRAAMPRQALWRVGARAKVSDTYSREVDPRARVFRGEQVYDREMLSIIRWVRHKDNTEIRRSFLEFRLRVQLTDWSPMPIQAKRTIFFKPHEGDVDDAQIEKWQRTANGRLEVIPIHGGHNSLMERDVALHIAQVLSAK